MQTIEVVAGAQFGSEAKGHVTAQIARRALDFDHEVVNVRVAGPNAGHTVYDAEGRKFALRQVPVGAAVSDAIQCYIAPGSEIDPEVLFSEISLLRSFGHEVNLLVSGQATVMQPEDAARETSDGISERLGSTSKGIGAARIRRLAREARTVAQDADLVARLEEYGVLLAEPHSLYERDDLPGHQSVIIEGTQGYGLGLHTAFYPYTTSSDCRAIDFLAMAGVNPWRASVNVRVTLVARMYPIRVAGNSGPLAKEATWEALGLPEERTTVTQKIRRVGGWDEALVKAAIRDNGGALSGQVSLAITMLDQKFQRDAGIEGDGADRLTPDAVEWLAGVRGRTGTPIRMVTTGPRSAVWLGGSI